ASVHRRWRHVVSQGNPYRVRPRSRCRTDQLPDPDPPRESQASAILLLVERPCGAAPGMARVPHQRDRAPPALRLFANQHPAHLRRAGVAARGGPTGNVFKIVVSNERLLGVLRTGGILTPFLRPDPRLFETTRDHRLAAEIVSSLFVNGARISKE